MMRSFIFSSYAASIAISSMARCCCALLRFRIDFFSQDQPVLRRFDADPRFRGIAWLCRLACAELNHNRRSVWRCDDYFF
jgi:hypothetical protein